MPRLQVKRESDPGVSTAVSSIMQHQNFKRMLMFGLRSLSDFCSPTSKIYKENAYDALDRGAVGSIKNAVVNYKDDDDILFCSSKILCAMSDYCCTEKDQEALQKLITDGGVDAIVEIIKSSPSDQETVKNCMSFIENMNELNVQIEGGELGIGLLNVFTSNTYNTKLGKGIACALSVAAKSSSGAKALNDEGAHHKLIDQCLSFQNLNDDVAAIVEGAFDTIKNMAANGYVDPTLIEKSVLILDKFKSYPRVVSKGSDAMKCAVGPEQLTDCLNVLKKSEQGSKEQDAALELLSSLSYISSITDKVVQSGGIPVLIELINSGLQQYESNPEKISRLVAGASRMLGRISANPPHAAIVYEYGGIASLCTALSYFPNDPECASAICYALTPFVSRSNYVSEINNYTLFASLLPILYGSLESVELAKASMECIASASMINEFHEHMVNNQAIEILSTCIQYHLTETDYLLNCLTAYFRLSDYITSIESINQYGGVTGIADALSTVTSDRKIAEIGLKLISKMLTASDALSHMSNQHVVDAVLTIMLENENEEVIIQEGTKIMEKLATENDCQRHISNLESVINSAESNPEDAYKTLAAISGLSRIQPLKSILESKRADYSVFNAIRAWIESPRFNDQTRLIKAGLKTIKILKLNSSSMIHEVIATIVDIMCITQVKRIAESEEPDENILITSAVCINDLTKVNKISSDTLVEASLDSIFKLMKKYSDSRLTQTNLLAAINNILLSSDRIGADILVNKGYVKQIVNYLQKVPMYVDVQIIGFTVLANLVKINPESIEVLRKANALSPLQTAMRTHVKNTKLKITCAPLLALLMPLDSLSKEIEELLKLCDNAMKEKNIAKLHECLVSLNELLLTPEASKISARCNIGESLFNIEKWLKGNPKAADSITSKDYDILGRSLFDATISEVAHACINISQTRIGLVHLTKHKMTSALIEAYDLLQFPGNDYTEEAVSNILESLSLLMKHDITNADTAFNSGMVKKLCTGINHFAESDVVIKSTCGCLACMCTDGKRVNQLISHPEYEELVSLIVKLLGNSEKNKNSRANAIKALHELLRTHKEEIIVHISSKTPVIDNLFKIMEEYQDYLPIVQESSKCLAIIADYVTLEEKMKIDKHSAIKIMVGSLSQNKNNEETALEILRVLVKLCNANDKMQLKELGAIDTVSDVTMIHSENEEISKLGGVLFSYMGADEQVKKLMKLILNVKNDDPDSVQKIDNLTGKLEIFLRAPLEDPQDALQYTEVTLQVLNEYLASEVDNVSLQANVALVTKRLVDRVKYDYEDQLGSWVVASAGTLNQYTDMISNKIGISNAKFVSPVYSVLAGCILNPYTKQLVMDKLPQLLDSTYEALEQHKNKPEVVQGIFEFLEQVAKDEEGAKLLYKQWNGSMGNLIDQTLVIMDSNRSSDSVCIPGMKLLGAISETANSSGYANNMNTERIIQNCELLLNSSSNKDRTLEFINLVDKMILANLLDEKVATDALKKIGDLVTEENLSRYSEQDRVEIMKAYAALIKDCAETGIFLHILPVEKINAVNNLARLIEYAQNPEVTASALEALGIIASYDTSIAAKILSSALPIVIENSRDNILSDIGAAEAFLQALENLLLNEGIGRQLANNKELYKLFEELENTLEKRRGELGDDYVDNMKTRINNIRNAINDDKPREKTCKDVYDILSQYTTSGTPINILQDPSLEKEMDFVLDRLKIYNKDDLKPTTEAGIDHSYGNMAIELFCEDGENISELAKKGFHTSAFHVIVKQSSENVKHYSCRAMCAFTKNPKGLEIVKEIKDYPNIISKSVNDLNMDKTLDKENKEEFLKSRVLLIDRTAYNRNVYDKTNAVHNLIEIWNDYDKGNYTVLLLRHVFRSMRKIVSDAHVQTLLKAGVLARLISIINNPQTDKIIFPDVLFLIGSLSVVKEIKTKIGELKGIEACVNLLLRSLNVEKMEPTITNCCLALANMCIDHKANSSIFCNLKGPDLNVRILREYRSNFDVTNGASVLLCNILFKNEEMKKHYGKNGSPAELVQCLKSYDGSDDKNAVRCIESLFKAISNLSLYTANIQYFLDAKIEVSYESWLNKLNESFPDAQLETGLRTLSNLVMENEQRNMKNFGVTLIPVLNVLKQNREDTKVIFLLLDILCSLCRLNENAKMFADNGGIETTINVIQLYDYDINLLALAIHLLSNQCKIESSLPLLVKANAFGILISCMEADTGEFEMTELVVASLRCVRRLIQSEELAYEFCNSGGVPSVANVICKSINQSIVMLEVLRVLLCVLYYTQNVEGVTNEYPEEEEELHNAKLGGWYNISMDKEMIDSIIQAVLTCANEEHHQKQLRLQKVSLGLLAYFAYHRLGIISMTASGFDALAKENLNNFGGDAIIMQLLSICIDNIAMYSAEVYDTTITRDIIKGFKNGLSKMNNKKEDKQIFQKVQLTLNAMNSAEDPLDAFKDTLLIFDFSLSEFDVDPYVNGVHDLPSNIKDTLRKGGSCKIFYNSDQRQAFKWKASQDLSTFEWTVGENLENIFKISIVRIKNISKGLSHPTLKACNKREPRKVTTKVTLCVFGPPTEEFPNGLELPIKTKTQKERDAFVDLIVLWRDAASYNY
ncbi:conserved Plasmodium protein, unknown function [Plasmodium relictum]|uniref:Glideosome-associated connector n=1 Tax=Plasmodium relictum TaxID=85471 RepID=A0A1J1H715_PLARL|nr:conserved Plasmodium protein, unknown function [Plasmodium relictum]CRH00742.1 conserved Plasmodium protein, unknown function [Plasmodium relictum]